MRAIHLYASSVKFNSGDFFLGPATKYGFENLIDKEIDWTSFDIRSPMTLKTIDYLNSFDYIVIGGGGLILPDSNPNLNSGWQWGISTDLLNKINKQIYVMSIGYNLFYKQLITMPNRGDDKEIPERLNIFKTNITTLIDKSTHFSMRHTGDINSLIKIIGESYRNKITFEFCPVIGYVKSKYSIESNGKYHAFEIKDDRPNRRYTGTTQINAYNKLLKYIEFLIDNNENIAVMSHDGSSSFYRFLLQNNIKPVLLDNTCANEKGIINNYNKVKKLYCTAGHSQMTAHALNMNYFTLIGHPKVEYFLKDVNKFKEKYYAYLNDKNLTGILKRSYK